MRVYKSWLLYVVTLFCFVVISTGAEAALPALIRGYVLDASNGAAVSGATVSGIGVQTTTVAGGAYALAVPLAGGAYSLTYSYYGYDPEVRLVNVASGTTATVNVSLARYMPGDCDVTANGTGNGSVSPAEVQSLTNMFLGTASIQSCGDRNLDGRISIGELQQGILASKLASYSKIPPVTGSKVPVTTLGTTLAIPGQRVVLPMTVTGNGASLSAMAADISYDPARLTNPAVTPGAAALTASKTIITNQLDTGRLRLGIIADNNTAIGDGIVAYVSFDVVSNHTVPIAVDFAPSAAHTNGADAVVSGTGRTFLTVASNGYAIIVVGKKSAADESGLTNHSKTAGNIYKTLRERGFTADSIKYYNFLTSEPNVDSAPTHALLQSAITAWAQGKMNEFAAPLYIVLVDHGDPGIFHLGAENVYSYELAQWLAELQAGLSGDAASAEKVVIVGTCASGSFISDLNGPDRIIITSARADESSYQGPVEPDGIAGGEFFIGEMFKYLKIGKSIGEAYSSASESTRYYTRALTAPVSNGGTVSLADAVQHPLLNDTGIGPGSTLLSLNGNGQTAQKTYLGTATAGQATAAFTQVTPTTFLDANTNSAVLSATVNDSTLVQNAWIEIRNPDNTLVPQLVSGQLSLGLRKIDMVQMTGNTFQVTVSGVSTPGLYDIYYYVQDKSSGEIAPQRHTTLYKNKSGNQSPSVFSLVSPANNTTQPLNVQFSWQKLAPADPDVNDPVTYTLKVAESNLSGCTLNETTGIIENCNVDTSTDPGKIVVEGITEGQMLLALPAKKFYAWQVSAIDSYGGITQSQVGLFLTSSPNGGPVVNVKVKVTDNNGMSLQDAAVIIDGAVAQGALLPGGTKLFALIPESSHTLSASLQNYQSSPAKSIVATESLPTVILALSPVELPKYAVSYSAGAGGSITQAGNPAGLSPVDVTSGSSYVFTVTPDSGYAIASVGGCRGNLTGNSYATGLIDGPCTVNATFGRVVDGQCGASYGKPYSVMPDSNLCTLGTASPVSLIDPSTWGWTCSGQYGMNPNCTATYDSTLKTRTGGYEYFLLSTAYAAAADTAIIQAKKQTIIENLVLNSAKAVTIDGGWNSDYSVKDGGYTTVSGSLMVRLGAVKITGALAVR